MLRKAEVKRISQASQKSLEKNWSHAKESENISQSSSGDSSIASMTSIDKNDFLTTCFTRLVKKCDREIIIDKELKLRIRRNNCMNVSIHPVYFNEDETAGDDTEEKAIDIDFQLGKNYEEYLTVENDFF